MGWDEDFDDDDVGPLLPPEDRLWRHPSEVAAAAAALAPPRSHSMSRSRRPWLIALASGIGGALAVGVAWLTLDSTPRTTVANTTVAVREITSAPRLVSAPDWAAAVTASASPAVTEVRTGAGTHSGVLIRDDGTLVTSLDAIGDATTAAVVLPDGRSGRASLVGSDTASGIAVLRLDLADVPAPPLAAGESAARGDWLAVAGTGAMPVAATVDDASASTVVDGKPLHGLIGLDIPVPESALGGAAVDDSGAVVAVVVGSDTRRAYGLPIGEVLAIVSDLDAFGEVRRPWLGVESTDTPRGAHLQSVDPGGPGAAAGLRTGDVVTRVDGRSVTSVAELVLALRQHQPGDAVRVEVLRGSELVTTEVVLGQRPG